MRELNRRILVTGANGNIGAKLVYALKARDFQVVSISSKVSLSSDISILVDWSDPAPIKLPEIDVVVNLASQTSPVISKLNRFLDARNNLLHTLYLLDALSDIGNKPFFIHIGSMSEYGLNHIENRADEIKVATTFYECSKMTSQLYVEQYSREQLIGKTVSLKLSNVYGNPNGQSSHDRGFIDRVIEKALLGEEIYIYGDGNYIRDFVRVDDVVQSIVATIDNFNNLRLDEYQVGTGLATTMSEMVGLIVNQVQMISGIRSTIKYRNFPEGAYSIDRRNSIAFVEPFIRDTNWHPKWSPVTGITDLLHRACKKGLEH